ncbi:MAG: hypothetical protein M3R70_08840 [Actinomycetota bacterium]|nr:hypothetical protein [Actinomycetota bacterium]
MSARSAQHDDLIWVRLEWLAEATAWIREHVEVAGEIEQPHIRWWSTVLRVPTPAGDAWFKATSGPASASTPGTGSESSAS